MGDTGESPRVDGVERIRERFQPDRTWTPRSVLLVVGLGGLALVIFYPGLPGSARLIFLGYLVIYLAWMTGGRRRARSADYLPLRPAPEGRRIVRPAVWGEIARREGMRFSGTTTPSSGGPSPRST